MKKLLLLLGFMPFRNQSDLFKYCYIHNMNIGDLEKYTIRLIGKQRKIENKLICSIDPYRQRGY